MISKEDLKYCDINEASEGIFPTYFLIDLKLTEEQNMVLIKLIEFLESLAKRHTPPALKTCLKCGRSEVPFFADTWGPYEYQDVWIKVGILKKIMEPNRIQGDHT